MGRTGVAKNVEKYKVFGKFVARPHALNRILNVNLRGFRLTKRSSNEAFFENPNDEKVCR